MNLMVTTSLGQDLTLVNQAKEISEELHIPYIPRQKQSLTFFLRQYDGVLLVRKGGVSLELQGGESLFFHPDTAMLRIKAERDPLLDLIGDDHQGILDCTMGLASDSLVMASAGHKITALESNPLIHFLVSYGLEQAGGTFSLLREALSRIQTVCVDSFSYLKNQEDRSVDCIYFDPMFSEKIKESTNLDGLAFLANPEPLGYELLAEAKRVARRRIILKAHFRDSIFEELGFVRVRRPNQKFHYGYIDIDAKN